MSKPSFWKWIRGRIKEWFTTPFTLGIAFFIISLSLALHDLFLYLAKEPRPIIWGKGIWAITVYGIISLPCFVIGILLMLYGWYLEFVKK
jgi:hypothetical protein